MKSLHIGAIIAFAAFNSFAQLAQSPVETTMTPERRQKHQERMARRAERIAAKGGFVSQPYTGKVYRVVCACKTVTHADLEQPIGVLSDAAQIAVDWRDLDTKETLPGRICALANNDKRAGAAIVILDDPDSPRLLVAPENGWTMVNVAGLKSDNPKHETFLRRLRQEFWRATCMLLGAYESMQKPCLMTVVCSNSDLDRNVCVIPNIEPIPKAKSTANRLGIGRARRIIYEQACREGWAPEPTNAVQKAVWESVRAEQSKEPEKAIQIKYDPKAGK